jgi:group I intron endonuclease
MYIKRFNEELEELQYFVYCFLDTRKPGKYSFGDISFDYEPIYIGKGKGVRPKRHLTLYKSYNNRFYSKLSSIINNGVEPIYITIKDSLSEEDAFKYEKYFISLIGRIENGGTLTNLSDGGEGQSGFKFSEESKKKMSDSRKGDKNYMFGKSHTDETKLKISLSNKGRISINKGKKLEDIVGVDKALIIKDRLSKTASERKGDKNGMFGRKHKDDSIEKMKNNRIKLFGEDNPSFGKERKESEKVYDSWELTDKEGNVVIVDNLNKFCRENSLNASCMRDLYYGTARSHKNWIKVIKLTDNVKKKKLD